MKKTAIYIVALLAAGSLGSCKKNLLVTRPDDRISTETFWKTENDAILAVNEIYTHLDGVEIFFWDGITDIGHTNTSFHPEGMMEQGIWDATNGNILDAWNSAYIGIERSNYFLENVDKVPSTNPTLINRLKGEARVLRAYHYIKLLGFFGAVPLITKTLSLEEGKAVGRDSVNVVYDFIDKELTEAADLLPASYSAADVGRVTKGAALAFKARADLWAGRYQQAVDAASAVMNLNKYALYPQFAKLFSYAAENSAEVIFDKQRIVSVASTNVFNLMAPYSQKNSNNTYVPTKALADLFTMKNGKEITDPTSGFDPYNPYVNRDPRMGYTMFLPGDVLPDGTTFNPTPGSKTNDEVGVTYHNTATGYTVKKYINKEDLANPSNGGINIILLRYAEVLLTYAEAKIELNQIDQSVLNAINQVRQRSDVGLPALAAPLTQDQLRTIVRRERTAELAFEGLRLVDIRRWKMAATVMPGLVYGITYNKSGTLTTVVVPAYEKVFNPKRDYLWPIPASERILNPNLGQNPNW